MGKGIVEQLRQAIADAEKRGVTRYAIAKAAGMKQAQLGRIADGENTPRLDTAERISQAIGLALKLVRR